MPQDTVSGTTLCHAGERICAFQLQLGENWQLLSVRVLAVPLLQRPGEVRRNSSRVS